MSESNDLSVPRREIIQIGNIEMSVKTGKLFSAIAKAQLEMNHPTKNKTAVVRSAKGEFSYKYADLPPVLDQTRALAKQGVALIQNPSLHDNKVFLTTVLGMDDGEDGQWIGGMLGMSIADDRPQTVGSAVSYARRYAAQSMAGVAAEEDDDGHQATHNEPTATQADPTYHQPTTARESQSPHHGPQQQFKPNPAKAGEPISEAQAKRLFAIGKTKGWGTADIIQALTLGWGIVSAKDILRKDYEEIIKLVDTESPLRALKKLQVAASQPELSSPPMEKNIPPFSDDDIPF